jgi:hypothetical protein
MSLIKNNGYDLDRGFSIHNVAFQRKDFFDPGYQVTLHGKSKQLLENHNIFTKLLGINSGVKYLNDGIETYRKLYGYAADAMILIAYFDHANNIRSFTGSFNTLVDKDIYSSILAEDHQWLLNAPNVTAGNHVLWSGALTYSTRSGLFNAPMDIGINGTVGDAQAFGGSLRLDLSSMGSAELDMFHALLRVVNILDEPGREPNRLDGAMIVEVFAAKYGFLNAFIRSLRRGHVTGTFQYQHIVSNSDNYSLGLDASKLISAVNDSKVTAGSPSGYFARFTLQGVSRSSYAAANEDGAKDIRIGAGLFWQNRIPYFGTKKSAVEPNLGRWTTQAGISVIAENKVDNDTTITGSISWRNLGSAIKAPIWSLSFGTGLRSGQFGIASVTFPFSL